MVWILERWDGFKSKWVPAWGCLYYRTRKLAREAKEIREALSSFKVECFRIRKYKGE